MSATIEGGGGGSWRNDSEYILDTPKLADRPAWLDEVDGYRERANGTDTQVTRVFQCPWSLRIQAFEYVLGYSYVELSPGESQADVAAAVAFSATVSGGDFKAVARLRRVIPMQDPERPWLFASECELIQGLGAWVDSPFVEVKDEDGGTVPDPLGEGGPLLARAIHYVSNDRSGGVSFTDTVLATDPDEEEDEEDEGEEGEDDEEAEVGDVVRPPTLRYSDGMAVLRVTFRAPDCTVISDSVLDALGGNELRRHVVREEEYGLQAVPLARLANGDALQLRFTTDPLGQAGVPPTDIINEVIREAGVLQQPLATLTYTVELPDRPMGAYARCLGCVNAEPFDGYGGSPVYPKGTLLCLPWKTRRRRGPTGRVMWACQFRLSFRSVPWNHFLAADGKYYLATFSANTGNPNGRRVYQPAIFDDMFKAVPPVRYIS